jgi:hypothetical protein
MSGIAVDEVTTPRLRDRLRANRGLLLVGVLVLLGALLLALAQSNRQRGFLDPAAVDPSGSAALATILEEQGVRVVRVTDASAAARELAAAEGDATLLVVPTALVSERMASTVGAAPRAGTVLLAPDDSVLAAYAPWASPDGVRTDDTEIEPGCAWDIATRTGPLPARGPVYATTRGGILSCWQGGVLDQPAAEGGGAFTTVVGDASAYTNDRLDESGNAALALNTLGRSATLVWWLPSANDPLQFDDDSPVQLTDLIPSWVGWALLQVAVAVLLTVWWRGRRLGRVVVEPLPVVVRATETVEGRARLYRRSSARGRAADALRAATSGRLRTRLALPRGVPLAEIVAAVAARTGRPGTDVAALLTPGGDPIDDAGLTRLAQELDNLENEVRRT